jgi:AcrR family transcriptional regulator
MSPDQTKPRDSAAAELIWTRPEPGTRGAAYSREQIAAAALRIADAEGFEAVSMRRLAAELGAGTMTLYHYVRNKKELLALMDNAVMGELLVPEGELPEDWRAALTAIARRTRETLVRHPWALEGLRGAGGGPNGMRHFEQSLDAVAGTGLDRRGRMELIGLIDEYVLGFITRAWVGRAGADRSALEEFPDELLEYFDSMIRSGEFPEVERLFSGGDARETLEFIFSVLNEEGRFDRGLKTLLDGVALALERRD